MAEKILLATTLLFAFFIYQMDKRLDDIALSIDSNNAILITLRDRAKKLQAEEKVEKLKEQKLIKEIQNKEIKDLNEEEKDYLRDSESNISKPPHQKQSK